MKTVETPVEEQIELNDATIAELQNQLKEARKEQRRLKKQKAEKDAQIELERKADLYDKAVEHMKEIRLGGNQTVYTQFEEKYLKSDDQKSEDTDEPKSEETEQSSDDEQSASDEISENVSEDEEFDFEAEFEKITE